MNYTLVTTRTRLLLTIVVLALSVGAAANGHGGEQGFALSVRAGIAVPGGDVDGEPNSKLSDGIEQAVPLQLEGTYGLTSVPLELGLFAGYGIGTKGTQLQDSTGSIAARSYGALLNYVYSSDTSSRKWLGVFVGKDDLLFSKSTNGVDVSSTISGVQAGLGVGAEWSLGSVLSVGPFASVAVGQYQSLTKTASGTDTSSGTYVSYTKSEDAVNKATHEWLSFGLRGRFKF